jgi:hypothetical protein
VLIVAAASLRDDAHMEKTYVIEWMPKLGAVKRRSPKLFTREEAEDLAEELNADHPEIVHEVLNVSFHLTPNPEPGESHGEATIIRNIDFLPAATLNLPIKEAALA